MAKRRVGRVRKIYLLLSTLVVPRLATLKVVKHQRRTVFHLVGKLSERVRYLPLGEEGSSDRRRARQLSLSVYQL